MEGVNMKRYYPILNNDGTHFVVYDDKMTLEAMFVYRNASQAANKNHSYQEDAIQKAHHAGLVQLDKYYDERGKTKNERD